MQPYLQTKRHSPETQSISAHFPFPHSWQIKMCGPQSLTVRHSGSEFLGHSQPQVPPRQVMFAQPPPGQGLQSSMAGQSLSIRHWPPHCACPGVQAPWASQVLRTAVSKQSGSPGAHCVQGCPHALPAQGEYPEQPGICPAQWPPWQVEMGQAKEPSPQSWQGAFETGHSASL